MKNYCEDFYQYWIKITLHGFTLEYDLKSWGGRFIGTTIFWYYMIKSWNVNTIIKARYSISNLFLCYNLYGEKMKYALSNIVGCE